MKSSQLRNFTATLSKIVEILLCASAGILVSIGLLFLILQQKISQAIQGGLSILEVSDINLTNISAENQIYILAFILFFSAILMVIFSRIFRNIHRIFQNTNTESPFAPANINLVKQIGFFAISIPICKIMRSLILGLILKNFQISVELNELLLGLIVLCLSQYFAYGSSLEQDVNGLV